MAIQLSRARLAPEKKVLARDSLLPDIAVYKCAVCVGWCEMVQIGGYLTPEEHSAFKRYAAEFQLKESSLANLLIVREIQLRRLGRLKQSFLLGARLKARARVTAHQSSPQTKEAFDTLAREAGISPDQAASVVFRAELSERWLARALSHEWNHLDSI